MARNKRREYIGFPEGLINRGMLVNNPPGELKVYKLSEEEHLAALEKYGPILQPRNRKMVKKAQ